MFLFNSKNTLDVHQNSPGSLMIIPSGFPKGGLLIRHLQTVSGLANMCLLMEGNTRPIPKPNAIVVPSTTCKE